VPATPSTSLSYACTAAVSLLFLRRRSADVDLFLAVLRFSSLVTVLGYETIGHRHVNAAVALAACSVPELSVLSDVRDEHIQQSVPTSPSH
jgi:hypothetical protein